MSVKNRFLKYRMESRLSFVAAAVFSISYHFLEQQKSIAKSNMMY